MIIWLNGPFGIGKTTTAGLIAERLPGARVFDPEAVGIMLRPPLTEVRPVADFREWPPWRATVAAAAVSLHHYLDGMDLVLPQTIPEQDYWEEIRGEIVRAGIDLLHVTLIADEDTHEQRIAADEPDVLPGDWRRRYAPVFRAAVADRLHRESTVLDTSGLARDAVADRVISLAGRSCSVDPLRSANTSHNPLPRL